MLYHMPEKDSVLLTRLLRLSAQACGSEEAGRALLLDDLLAKPRVVETIHQPGLPSRIWALLAGQPQPQPVRKKELRRHWQLGELVTAIETRGRQMRQQEPV